MASACHFHLHPFLKVSASNQRPRAIRGCSVPPARELWTCVFVSRLQSRCHPRTSYYLTFWLSCICPPPPPSPPVSPLGACASWRSSTPSLVYFRAGPSRSRGTACVCWSDQCLGEQFLLEDQRNPADTTSEKWCAVCQHVSPPPHLCFIKVIYSRQ